jgi:addiction module RelB/DinJ family antitoxin
MDERLKKQFDLLCSDFGMTPSAAFNIFARTVVKERRIPFAIEAAKDEALTPESGYDAFMALRKEAKDKGVQDWSLSEINSEISDARSGEA